MSVTSSPIADHVVRIVIDDAGELDRRDLAGGLALRDALLQAADDDDVKVIVLAGLTGTIGSVVDSARADPRSRSVYSGVRGLHQVLTYCKKVTIVEVDGDCGSTGTCLCLAADFVVASEGSRFASPFAVAEANYPLAVLTMRANRTKAWMIGGEPLAAAAAATAGFVNQVVSSDQVQATSIRLARRAALMPLDGITVSKLNLGATFDVVGVGREFDSEEASLWIQRGQQ